MSPPERRDDVSAEALPDQPHATVNDAARLAALDSYRILDTPAEAGFDDIVQITTAICDVPVALVSLVTHDRQWFKARIGFEPCETDLERSVCRFALIEPDLLVIPDLTQDARTKDNPLVTAEPRIRFYAGAPLRRPDGLVLGSLCAIDVKPRPGGLSERQATTLRNLARQVMQQLSLRSAITERDALMAERARAEARRLGLLTLVDHLRDLESEDEMTRVAAAIVGETLGVQRVGYGRLETRDHLLIETEWSVEGMPSIVGRHTLSDYGDLAEVLDRGDPIVVDDVSTDPRTAGRAERLLALRVGAMVNMPIRHRGPTGAVLFVHGEAPRAWTPEVLTFIRNVADRVEVGIARIRAEAEQRVLNLELSHRMKNSFAMVQAIATQTLRGVTERDAVQAFTQRLQALSSAHDVLLQRSWAAAQLGHVVRSVLGTVEGLNRFDVSGPPLEIGPRATLSLSLLLHELAINAMKYGSLRAAEGRVEVAWRLDLASASGELVLGWTETGGEPPRPPDRKGFGSRLIGMGLAGAGGVEIRYPVSGLQAEFRAPLDQVRAS